MVIKKYLNEILLLFSIFLILLLMGYTVYRDYFKKESVEITNFEISKNPGEKIDVEKEEIIKETSYYVDIKGAVKNPGVYEVYKDNIINDVISLAGGFNSNAYTNNINLSKSVSNHMVIYVYTKYEYSLLDKPEVVYIEKECKCEEYDIKECISSGSSIIEEGEDTFVEKEDEKENVETTKLVNINTAGTKELTSLNGIGESKAKSIIDYRNENGLFSSIEDITKVSGISDALFAKIKNDITV